MWLIHCKSYDFVLPNVLVEEDKAIEPLKEDKLDVRSVLLFK